MASRPRCDRPCRGCGHFFRSRDPRPGLSGGAEGKHPLDVPCHGHEAPLATHLVEPAPKNPTPVEAMAHRLKTPEGRKLYSLRKQIPEPVFGIIKSVLGFRQFLLRGLDKVRGEWSLVTMAWNIKRMFTLSAA